MSELLDIYQDNIKNVFTKINRILDNLNMYSSDKCEIAINEADTHLKEAERLIKNMELQSLTSNADSLVLKNFKIGLDSYKKKVNKAKESIKLDSLILTTDSSTQKEKLINNDELVWSSFDKLQNAKRSTIELENVSIEVARELQGHSEKMKDMDHKMKLMNNDISTSTGLISRMLNLQRRNKIIISIAGITFFLIFLIFIFFRFSSNSKETSTNHNYINNSSYYFPGNNNTIDNSTLPHRNQI